jgi:heavy metal sensor kinase
VLAASFAAGFAWVHIGLRRVLEARNDSFLEREASELLAAVPDRGTVDLTELEAEIRRELPAYEPDSFIVIVRAPDRLIVEPHTENARLLAAANRTPGTLWTFQPRRSGGLYRVFGTRPTDSGVRLDVGISLGETEATLAQFDRAAAGGATVFLAVAIVGGLFLSRQALRPVAESVRTAKRLDPADLSERLPQTGAGDELDELAGTINGLLDRLAKYHAQVTRFTADASHELRSPLGAMRAAVDVALQQPRGSQEYRDTLASIGEQCDRLTALVNGLLLLARADAGEVSLQRESLDLAAVVREVAEFFEPLADEREIRLIAETPALVPIHGDPSRCRQLVTNLLDNAIRFTGPRGSVRVTVERVSDRAVLRVCDDGVGIAPENLPHIFERFYQTDASRASGGSGLGLSITRWIVEAHGGMIDAQSALGQGATFVVSIPIATA